MRKRDKIARLRELIDKNTEKAMKCYELNRKYNNRIDKLYSRNSKEVKE